MKTTNKLISILLVLKTVDGVEYLIIEWKSGDYRYGGFDTNYYVFIRA